ncbi:MAG TPA: hypothetical protein VMV77_11065 [Bacteroidales bacterium]|nr:hypothetical protein [Bacteroidales bacterium]
MSVYLKKIVIISFFLLFAFKAFAPSSGSMIIIDTAPIEPFKKLIHAIGMVETRFDTLAYNPIEEATGYFQIRPIRIIDYNKRTGSNYTTKDMYDYKTSEKIFLYYASQIGPYNFERIAKNWNGSGKKTIQYWKRVKKYL